MQPEAQYRVSVKGLIRDASGRVLLNKENGHTHFGLPGGGIDHGETPGQALKRELFEELQIESFTYTLRTTKTFYSEFAQKWMLWIVFDITCDDTAITRGQHSDAVRWFDDSELDLQTISGRLIKDMLQ